MEDISGGALVEMKKKKPNNGWTEEQETLIAEWADTAACYRWLHDRAEKGFTRRNHLITIPVIILSTLTGSANFALNSVIPAGDESLQRWAQFGIGGVSIIAGIITTLGNFFRYAQNSEANRVAAISWGKFHRLLRVELNLQPDDRQDCQDFLKMCRNELDRLIEQSPQISDKITEQFKKKFGTIPNLKKPDICDDIEHTTPFDDRDSKMRKVAAEAALTLLHRKRMLKEIVQSDIDEKVQKGIEMNRDMIRVVIKEELEKSNAQV